MEQDQLFDIGLARQFHGFAPGAMAPTLALGVFFAGILRVVDQDVRPLGVIAQGCVGGGVSVLVIAGVDDGRARGFDAVSGCPVRMVKREGADEEIADAGAFGFVFTVMNMGRDGDRIVRRKHLIGKDFSERFRCGVRVNRCGAGGIVERREVGQALNVIPMEMGEEKVDCFRVECVAEGSDAAACVKDDRRMIGETDFDARRIAAVAEVLRVGSGNGASNAPEGQA